MTLILSGTNGLSDVDGSAATPAIRGTDTNTGVFFPAADTVGITTGGNERARIDSSGNLGLGVTPSAWSGFTALQIQNGALFTDSTSFRSIMNGYYNGSNWIYSTTNAATRYEQVNGIHRWFNAASGTAGNAISFTQAMTLDSSGYLLVGATSSVGVGANRFQLGGSQTTVQSLLKTTTGHSGEYVTGQNVYKTWVSGGFLALGEAPADGSTFTERARIDSSGNLLVGVTSSTANGGVSIVPGANPYVYTGGSSNSNTTSAYYLYSSTAGAYRFYVGYGGTISAVSTSITGLSDQRLKENIRDLDDGLEKVMALQPRKFDWKEGKGAGTKNARGFVAQEFETVFPDMIEQWIDEPPEGEEPYKAVNANLIPTLVKAIQEQQAIITQLQADIETLKGKA